MLTFAKEELVPSTVVSRSLSSILNRLKDHSLNKVAVMRNNEMEAIILPIEEYEILQSIMEKDEYRNIYSAIKDRKATALEEYPSIDDVLATLSQTHEKI
jgi:PHD/YefM family antitoxin component YafN of YafNO toxin-antitoxin module